MKKIVYEDFLKKTIGLKNYAVIKEFYEEI